MDFACYTEWDQVPAGAETLFTRASADSIFFSRPWFENLSSHGLEDGQSMVLACVIDGDRVLALLPLMTRGGEHLQALGHLYTSLYTLLLAEQDRREILACLASGLSRLPVDSLLLAPVADDDGRLLELQQAMESSGYSCYRHFRFYNWFHRLDGESFADYMAARPSRVRNTIMRKQRKLAREQRYSIRLYSGDDLQQGMADYNAVYDASWKARELFADFVDGLAERLSGRGWLRLAVLYIAGKPAAAQFWFVAHGKASIFKLVYDEAWKRYSPGSILTRYLMEHVIETDRVEEIDFLTGNDAYKGDWMTGRRERWSLYCARPRVPGSRTGRWLEAAKGWMRGARSGRDADSSLNP